MNDYLFVFTITPVQSFIAQARKTQDLYEGSQILSDLVRKGIDAVDAISWSKELILPDPSIPYYPNRFIAVVSYNDIAGLDKKIEKCVKCVKEELIKFADDALERANCKTAPSEFHEQVEGLFQVFWAAIPYPNADNYSNCFRKIESILTALKNTRLFDQRRKRGRKCSVCGERNLLFCRKDGGDGKRSSKERLSLKPRWDMLSEEERKEVKDFNRSIAEIDGYKIASGEGLCSVCFIKRYRDKTAFPSTAEIALMETMEKLKGHKCMEDFKRLFNSHTFDAQLYYEENLTVQYFDRHDLGSLKSSLQQIKESQRKIASLIKENGLRLNRYYALVMLDGDDMGRWLSGRFLKDSDMLREFHKEAASKLGEYSKKVSGEVIHPKGRLVYAGGDDLLAFINLYHLTDIMGFLKEEFPKLEDIGPNGTQAAKTGINSTPSAGIVIAHYKTPLSEVIGWTRRMQKEAKGVKDKDAVGIALMPHSGNIVKLVCRWEYIGLLKEVKDIMEHFSDRFVFSLNREMLPLFEGSEWQYRELDYLYEIIATEFKRLLVRAKRDLTKDDAEKKAGELAGNSRGFIRFNLKEDKYAYRFDIHNFSALLEIARFLAKETK